MNKDGICSSENQSDPDVLKLWLSKRCTHTAVLKTPLRLLNLIDSTLNSMLLTISVSSQIFSKCCLTSVTVAIHQSRLHDIRWIWWCQNLTLTTERGISTNRNSLRVYILRCSVMYLYLWRRLMFFIEALSSILLRYGDSTFAQDYKFAIRTTPSWPAAGLPSQTAWNQIKNQCQWWFYEEGSVDR